MNYFNMNQLKWAVLLLLLSTLGGCKAISNARGDGFSGSTHEMSSWSKPFRKSDPEKQTSFWGFSTKAQEIEKSVGF